MRKISLFKLKIIAKIIVFTLRVESRVWCWAKIIINKFPVNWWYQQELLSKELLDHFLLEKKVTKINWHIYLEHLQNEMIPSPEKLFPSNDFIFIRDSAPSTCARKVQNFSKEMLTSHFVENFDWPPNSPDCKSLDYFFLDKL